MSYCPKQIKICDIDNYMDKGDLEFTLASCEQSCDRYYGCDTVAYMLDRLKEKKYNQRIYLCPICGCRHLTSKNPK